MAEIVEVIHRINYEVNDAQLQNAVNVIHAQIRELNNLYGALDRYQRQLVNVRDTTAFNELSRKVDGATRQIEASLGKTKGILAQFGSGLLKGLGLETDLEGAVEKWLEPLNTHLESVKSKGNDTVTSLGGIAARLTSFSGLAPLAIGLLSELADEFFSVSEETKRAREEQERYNTALAANAKTTRADIGGKQRELDTLRKIIENSRQPESVRNAAIGQLRQRYRFFTKGVSDGDLRDGKAGSMFSNISTAVHAQGMAAGIDRQMEKEIEDRDMVGGIKSAQLQAQRQYDQAKKKLEEAKQGRYGKVGTHREVAEQIYRGTTHDMELATSALEKANASLRAADNRISVLQTQLNKENQKAAPLSFSVQDSATQPSAYTAPRTTRPKPSSKPQQVDGFSGSPWDDEVRPGQYMSVRKQELVRPDPELTAHRVEVPELGISKKGKGLTEKQKENLDKAKETYQTLAQTAVDAFNTIYDAQIASLDKEIDLRRQRVEQATQLAERGNTEQLALEQDRLAKAEAARDSAARKQLQLNALLQASNSAVALTEAIGAVVGTAAEGDPYTIALRVAAAVAALVAGIAAVSTAFGKVNGGGAYKDGVVDFKGAGGPRDDANWVRISSGESVITAKGTAANRSILEAINKGTEFKMLNSQLLVPALAATGNGGFASKENLKGLEKKLDGVIDAVKDSKLKQDIFFNEHGVGLMTQRVIRRDQNRFK